MIVKVITTLISDFNFCSAPLPLYLGFYEHQEASHIFLLISFIKSFHFSFDSQYSPLILLSLSTVPNFYKEYPSFIAAQVVIFLLSKQVDFSPFDIKSLYIWLTGLN